MGNTQFAIDAVHIMEKQEAEIARLRAEVEVWRREAALMAAHQGIDNYDRLRAEVEALRKDAERYRWIERHARSHWNGSIGQLASWSFMGWPFSQLRGDTLDEAIDTCLKNTDTGT